MGEGILLLFGIGIGWLCKPERTPKLDTIARDIEHIVARMVEKEMFCGPDVIVSVSSDVLTSRGEYTMTITRKRERV